MRVFFGAMAIVAALIGPAMAKNFAVPPKNPAMTVTFPEDWKIDEIDYGFTAKDPDENVAIYIESADDKGVDGLMKLNKDWMVEQKIEPQGKPDERQVDFGSVKGTLYSYAAKDSNGPTVLQFLVIPASENRVILLTVWASKEEREKKQAELDAVFNSLKAIN